MSDILEEEEVDEVDWRQKWEELYFQYQDLGSRYQGMASNFNRIWPLYQKYYKHWWFWFIAPMDSHITGIWLFRCKTCGRLFVKGGPKEFTEHKGHMYSVTGHTTFFEWLKFKLGLIR